MKNWYSPILIFFISILLTACGSGTKDVVSLGGTSIPEVADEILDNETLMMEYTACLRGEGIEVSDPVVNANGFVGKPQFLEDVFKDELVAAIEVCAPLLMGFTFEQKAEDISEEVDKLVALAACLREEGITIDDPTAETLDTWQGDLKSVINFDDPSQVQVFETCSGGNINKGDKK
jgi:hypothetical protein